MRISNNSERLISTLTDLKKLNQHLLEEGGAQVIEAITGFIKAYGYSLLILSKLAYARAKFSDRGDVVSFCDRELDKYGARRRSAITLAAIDMMRDSYEFIPLRRNLLEFANSKGVKTFHSRHSKLAISSYPFHSRRFIFPTSVAWALICG